MTAKDRFEIKRHGQELTFKLNKGATLVVGVDNETLSVAVSVRVSPRGQPLLEEPEELEEDRSV